MKSLSRLAIAALLAAAVAPAFARGQPQLPNDDGSRASVLQELNPARAHDGSRCQSASASEHHGGNAGVSVRSGRT
ncbi:MAG: hypothetical protein LBJ65_13990 [Burkholderia sp.]|jgi:hypothetical protein|uniref:hypothetical protein n=1 Tax=Burkholderia sp. TaxID=36773 RepID=UPI0028285BD0|nr:hypothetical protein [Burkholderia sp.]MDR0242706.1 hypothetical protein [Burkholderia sp.]